MTDDAQKPAPAPSPIELPMAGWVKGGTTTLAYDNQLAAQKADADRRRAIQDQQYRATRQDPVGARMTSMKLGGSQSHACIVLGLKHPKDGQILDWIVCELIAQPDDAGTGTELVLNMACPRCAAKDPQNCQIKIQQTNRAFWLDTKRAGELWVNPKDPNEIITLAGTVTSNGWMTCPGLGCGWKFRFDDSVVYTA